MVCILAANKYLKYNNGRARIIYMGTTNILECENCGWQNNRRERETTPRVARLSSDLGKRVACAASTFRISYLGYRVQQERRCHATPCRANISQACRTSSTGIDTCLGSTSAEAPGGLRSLRVVRVGEEMHPDIADANIALPHFTRWFRENCEL